MAFKRTLSERVVIVSDCHVIIVSLSNSGRIVEEGGQTETLRAQAEGLLREWGYLRQWPEKVIIFGWGTKFPNQRVVTWQLLLYLRHCLRLLGAKQCHVRRRLLSCSRTRSSTTCASSCTSCLGRKGTTYWDLLAEAPSHCRWQASGNL